MDFILTESEYFMPTYYIFLQVFAVYVDNSGWIMLLYNFNYANYFEIIFQSNI